jgi:LytS/YehU family sensor histidine kinase
MAEHGRRWRAVVGLWIAILLVEAWRAPWWTPASTDARTAWASAARAIGLSWYPWTVLAMIAAAATLAYRRQSEERRRETAALERLVAEARLETLRTQLNPHFLFNALNAISAHVERDPRTARAMLEQLGNLLRMSLEHAREQETPLAQELAFIESYVDLQKVRFEDRFDVITTIDPAVMDALVPSLILQPLVENAIRHGMEGHASAIRSGAIRSGAVGSGPVGSSTVGSGAAGIDPVLATPARSGPVQIEIKAWREDSLLRLTVHDDGPGLPSDWDPEHGLGVGLSNTRERLRRLYGSRQTFTIASNTGSGAGSAGSGVAVSMTLPFRAADGARTRTVADNLDS